MGSSAVVFLLPSAQTTTTAKPQTPHHLSSSSTSPLNRRFNKTSSRNPPSLLLRQASRSSAPVARLFGPAIFEASKLKVLLVGVDVKHPAKLPRRYTLTHSDITSNLTLAISNTIHRAQLQGWYNRLQRDEVVAEWRKVKGEMSLHVHCHISGGHFLLDLIAPLRYYIFSKELPVVLKAFVHGDESLFANYPELEEALVWVYFHSNLPQFNRVECWGPLKDAVNRSYNYTRSGGGGAEEEEEEEEAAAEAATTMTWAWPQKCQSECNCCFPPHSLIPWPHDIQDQTVQSAGQTQQNF